MNGDIRALVQVVRVLGPWADLVRVAFGISADDPKGVESEAARDTSGLRIEIGRDVDRGQLELLARDGVDESGYNRLLYAAFNVVLGPVTDDAVLLDVPECRFTLARMERAKPNEVRYGTHIMVFSDDQTFDTGVEVRFDRVSLRGDGGSRLVNRIREIVERVPSR